MEMRNGYLLIEIRIVANIIAFAVMFSLGNIAFAESCEDRIDRESMVLSNGFSFNSFNTRNQQSDISSENVANLKLVFAHAAVGSTGKRGALAVTDQTIYFSEGRDIVAVNRQTGCLYWRYSMLKAKAGIGENLVRSSSIYLINDDPGKPALIVGGDSLGNVAVVNAVTGEEVWSKFMGTSSKYHWITGGFQYYGGKLFFPLSSKEVISAVIPFYLCCRTHGLLQAVDPYSGNIIWTYHTTEPAEFRFDTFRNGPSGASIWSVPAIDPDRNTLYIGTGQNYSPPHTETADAIIALDIDTGKVRWIFKASNDIWNASCELPEKLAFNCTKPIGYDFDFGAPPVLVKQPGREDVVLAADKGGVVYSIDAENGSLRWAKKIGLGSALGGVHFGMAIDQRRIYVSVADTFADKSAIFTRGLMALLGGISYPLAPVPNGSPGIYALDIQSGEQIWYIKPKHVYEGKSYVSIYSAALSVTNDVLFAGALDGELSAFSTLDGSLLWKFDSDIDFVAVDGEKGSGGTIDSVGAVPAGDMLLLNSGYDNFGSTDAYQGGPGNGLFVFRLHQ